MLLQETLNFFSLLSRGGGARPPGPPSGYAPALYVCSKNRLEIFFGPARLVLGEVLGEVIN